MRHYTNADVTENFLSDEDQRDLIATAQDVPTVVTTDNDGREVVRYARTSASEAALTRLVQAFSPLISSVARTSKVLGFEEAEATCYERFIKAVREYDLTSPAPFSRDIRSMLRFEISDKDRTSDLVRVAENVAARYFRLLHKHGGDVRLAYEECRTTANGFDPATFLAVHRAVGHMESLDRTFGEDDHGYRTPGGGATATLAHEASLALAGMTIDEELAHRDLVRWLFTKIDDRDETILRLRYGFDDLATENIRSAAGFRVDDDLVLSDRQVAQALHMTTPTVNRLRNRALGVMRDALDELAADETA